MFPPAMPPRWRENPWCAVIDYDDGGVTWDCNYRTFEECYPNVLAGNKGSCNLNPAGPGPQAATPAADQRARNITRSASGDPSPNVQSRPLLLMVRGRWRIRLPAREGGRGTRKL